MTYQYRINKTVSMETNGPLTLNISYINTSVARLYFTDKKGQLVQAGDFDYAVKDLTAGEVILPYQGSYYIVWTSNYEVLYKARSTVVIENSKQQTLRRVLPPEQQNPGGATGGTPNPFPNPF